MPSATTALARLAILVFAIHAGACAHAPPQRAHDAGRAAPSQNLGLLKADLLAYGNGAYFRDIAEIDAAAEKYVAMRAPHAKNPALVLDIDETALSNWPQLVANDFGYFKKGKCEFLPEGPCGTLEWDKLGEAAAIEPTRQLFDAARSAGVKVFFVTGRHEFEREATESNLSSRGYHGWEAVVMKPNGDGTVAAIWKAGARADIETRGFTIIANVGDQQSDLDGGHAERTFKLPNPFYFIR
jgi:acid phosphatase